MPWPQEPDKPILRPQGRSEGVSQLLVQYTLFGMQFSQLRTQPESALLDPGSMLLLQRPSHRCRGQQEPLNRRLSMSNAHRRCRNINI